MAVKCLKEGAPSPPIYTRLCGWLVMEWVLGEGGVNPIAHGTHLPIYMLWRFVECSPTHMRFIKSISEMVEAHELKRCCSVRASLTCVSLLICLSVARNGTSLFNKKGKGVSTPHLRWGWGTDVWLW